MKVGQISGGSRKHKVLKKQTKMNFFQLTYCRRSSHCDVIRLLYKELADDE